MKKVSLKELYTHAYSWMMIEPRGFVAAKLMLLTEDERREVAALTPEVINVKTDKSISGVVQIGRPSIYGNPYKIGEAGTRDEVITAYKLHLAVLIDSDEAFINALEELHGKRLGCFCHPEACHGDVLAELVRNRLIAEKFLITYNSKSKKGIDNGTRM